MSASALKLDPLGGGVAPAWFCFRSHPKHEHIAAAHLRTRGLEVYLPQIRFKRCTRRGPVWCTEASFLNYFFARCELGVALRSSHHAHGVQGVVHFGGHWPTVPDEVINSLRQRVGADHIHIIHEELRPGQTVRIEAGMFRGLEAIVTRAMPGRQRVAVLLEFLGSQATLELANDAVQSQIDKRHCLL